MPTDDLLTIRRGHDHEIRVTLREHEGRPFLSLALYRLGDDGRFQVVRGLSLTLEEARRLAEVLADPQPPRKRVRRQPTLPMATTSDGPYRADKDFSEL